MYYAKASKRVTSLRGPFHVIAPAFNTAASLEKMLQRWQAIGNSYASDLRDPDLNLRLPAPETNALTLNQHYWYYSVPAARSLKTFSIKWDSVTTPSYAVKLTQRCEVLFIVFWRKQRSN